MPAPTRLLDLSTRYFWRAVGRRIELGGDDRWLWSPTNAPQAHGDDWLEVLASGGRVRAPSDDDGLLSSFSALDATERSFGSATIGVQGQIEFEEGLPPVKLEEAEFRKRYLAELADNEAVAELRELAHSHNIPFHVILRLTEIANAASKVHAMSTRT